MVTPAPVHRISVILARTPLVLLASVWRVAATPIAELGAAAFMVAGSTLAAADGIAPWAVLLACLLGAFLRTVDLESWALIMPNGLVGRGEAAFGPRGGRLAAAVGLVERILAATLALVLIGRHAAVILAALSPTPFPSGAVDDLATLGAVLVLAVLWLRARVGQGISRDTVVAAVWIGAASLSLIGAAAAVVAFRNASAADLFPLTGVLAASGPRGGIITLLIALAFALPVVGSGSAVAAAAHEFPAPRLPSLLRMSMLVVLVSLAMIAVPAFALSFLPPEGAARWMDAPVLGLALEMSGAAWVQGVASLAIVGAAFLLLVPAAHRALADAEQGVRRLSVRRSLPTALAALHPRFGTPAKSVDLIALATMVIALVSGSRIAWLGAAYAFAVGFRALFKVTAILRLRWLRAEPAPFVAPFNLPIGSRQLPVGLLAAGLLLIATLGALLGAGGLPVVATLFAIVCLTMLFAPRASDRAAAIPLDSVPLLSPSDVYPGPIDARPGNILVPVRNPSALMPITAALRGATDRDVVVMTVRLLGVDVDEESAGDPQPTPAEADLLARASTLAERHGRPIRLLIVPALNPIDAITATALRLGSSEIHVGESSTLAADAQARLLGEAWERVPAASGHTIRLVIHHPSGRADAFHIGAHLPALTPGDLDLIHRLWLDASKAVGPHIHHHDVVRAALTQMEQQMSGPAREDALATIRRTARPADELATIIKARDYPRLRDLVRNRDAADMVTLLSELSLEDQVVFFRVLPRKDAAAVFEYLSADAQEALLKTMAHEDVATLLGHMAPDDRTMFLEELPAAATRQLLALLTPAERSVALTLLGYPEGSIGRLDDAELRRRPGRLDGAGGARSHSRARRGSGDAGCHLRRRRGRQADRRHPHPRAVADGARHTHLDPDGPARRRAQGDRESADGRRRVPQVRSRRPAGDRYCRRSHRHRHD